MKQRRAGIPTISSPCTALRARENSCFAVLTDQAGRAGTLDNYPKDHENQPHHAGVAMIWGPDGEVLASSQRERVQEEMIVADLDPRCWRASGRWQTTDSVPAGLSCSESWCGIRYRPE